MFELGEGVTSFGRRIEGTNEYYTIETYPSETFDQGTIPKSERRYCTDCLRLLRSIVRVFIPNGNFNVRQRLVCPSCYHRYYKEIERPASEETKLTRRNIRFTNKEVVTLKKILEFHQNHIREYSRRYSLNYEIETRDFILKLKSVLEEGTIKT